MKYRVRLKRTIYYSVPVEVTDVRVARAAARKKVEAAGLDAFYLASDPSTVVDVKEEKQ